jgi:hypothetical protein
MATEYLVKCGLTIEPVQHVDSIPVRIGINNNLTVINLQKETKINFEFMSKKSCDLSVEMLEKKNQEAIIVKQIDFFGIADPKFAWSGIYRPKYPEPWASEQRSHGIELAHELCPHTYLGWPGTWILTFDVPVFSWIHHVQNLGWVYR